MGAAASQGSVSPLLTDPISGTGLTTCSPSPTLRSWYQQHSLYRMNDYLLSHLDSIIFQFILVKNTR